VDDSERQPTYLFEGFRLDSQRRTLLGLDHRPVPLAPKTLDALSYLVEHAGHVVDKRELLEAIWPHVVVEENNLNQTISQLRRALGERPNEHRFIVTEPGRGYRFVANVSVEPSPGNEPVPRTASSSDPTLAPPRRAERKLSAGVALAAVLAALIALGAWYLGRDRSSDALPNSIAVLPFENLSPDPANAYFAAGLHGEILSQLAKISALNVIGQSSLPSTDTARPAREIAAELNAETVLYATVEYAEGRVRIRPQLVSGETGQTLWAESYDRGFEDIFAIESEIAMEIANALRAEFSVAEQAAVATPPTKSPAAYAAYLRARALANASDELALGYLDDATRLDPGFALAYAAKARQLAAMFVARIGQEAADPTEWNDLELRIRSDAGEALRLDPDLWLAHLALSKLHEHRWRWTEALRDHERVAATAPRGVRRVAEFKPFFGEIDFAESIPDQRDVIALNPRVAGEHWVLGLAYAYQRDAETAAASFREAVSLEPDNPVFHVWLARSAR
jgi:TolB-like protein/DNA-binding winged helix-turn-helix (wHTH) protein